MSEKRLAYIASTLDPELWSKQFGSSDLFVRYFSNGDPTTNKQYTQWLIRAYVNGSKAEDLVSRGYDSLTKFEKLKKKKFLKGTQADIGRLFDLEALEILVDSIFLPEEEHKVKGKYEELLNNDEVRIIVPLDEAAARYYGQGTKWCTAATKNSSFEHYDSKGALVILIPKQPQYVGEKYQIHLATKQRRNEKDKPLSQNIMESRFPSICWMQIRKQTYDVFDADQHIKLNKGLHLGIMKLWRMYYYAGSVLKARWPEAEPTIMKDPRAAYFYARKVIKGRWPEAEPIIKENAWAGPYARNVIKGRWSEAEPYIVKDPKYASRYARDIMPLPHSYHTMTA